MSDSQAEPANKTSGATPTASLRERTLLEPSVASEALSGRRRVGIMGGTFDPIHHGHLVAASEVMDVFNLDQVVFVPVATQPFKQGTEIAPAEHRYLMAEIATASNNRFTVSRVDIDLSLIHI